jgi:uncharacterized protein (UPF0147 family)
VNSPKLEGEALALVLLLEEVKFREERTALLRIAEDLRLPIQVRHVAQAALDDLQRRAEETGA